MEGVFQSNEHNENMDKIWALLPMTDATSQQFRALATDLEEFPGDWGVWNSCGNNTCAQCRYRKVGSTTIDSRKIPVGKPCGVDTVLSTNFTVTFYSDSRRTGQGFVLHWRCNQWAEWAPARDGTCRHVRRPLHNGTMTTGALMYKRNETCTSGNIKLLEYGNYENRSWPVYSNCESVRMISTQFITLPGDIVTIGETEYSGVTNIDTILSTNFTVSFLYAAYSLDWQWFRLGFDLHWRCTKS